MEKKLEQIFIYIFNLFLNNKFLFFVFILFFSLTSYIYTENFLVDKKKISISTTFFSKFETENKAAYIISALEMMDVSSFEQSVFSYYPHKVNIDTNKFFTQTLLLKNKDLYPDIEPALFPEISITNEDENANFAFSFNFEDVDIDSAKKNIDRIIEDTISEVNDHYTKIINQYFNTYQKIFIKHQATSNIVSEKNAAALKHEIALLLLEESGYFSPDSFIIFDMIKSPYSVSVDIIGINQPRFIFVSVLFGLVMFVLSMILIKSLKYSLPRK